MEWVVLGAKLALGSNTVTDRGGIQPVAAQAEPAARTTSSANASAGCGGRARMFLECTKRGTGRPAPRLRVNRSNELHRDYLRIVIPTFCLKLPASMRAK